MKLPKRLIEADLPIARISAQARREKSIRHGHISTLHIWWARRPLAACRSVVLASLWPDPVDLMDWARQGDQIRIGDGTITIRPARFLDEAHRQMERWIESSGKDLKPETYKRVIAIRKDRTSFRDAKHLRACLLDFIADFSDWDRSVDAEYVSIAQALTQAAHECLGGEPGTRPMVIDPFAGGGSIPLEVLRVGGDVFASDLNPIPVLLNKVVLEYIPKYGQRLAAEVRCWGQWIKQHAEEELAAFYPSQALKLNAYFPQPRDHISLRGGGTWHLDGVERETPIAYLWARTILSEAPGQGEVPVEVPLMRSMWLAKKSGRQQALRWARDENGTVKTKTVEVTYHDSDGPMTRRVKRPVLEIFRPQRAREVESGTVARGNATCPVTGYTTSTSSVRKQLKRRTGGAADARLMAVVTSLITKRYIGRREQRKFRNWDERGRFYRLPTRSDEKAFAEAEVELAVRQRHVPEGRLSIVPNEVISLNELRRISVPIYGMERWGDLFSPRQVLSLVTLARLVREASDRMKRGETARQARDSVEGTVVPAARRIGQRARTYALPTVSTAMFTAAGETTPSTDEDTPYPPGMAEAVQTCLGMVVGRQADYASSLAIWSSGGEFVAHTFGRQAVPMVWEFPECCMFTNSSGNFEGAIDWVARVIDANVMTESLTGQVEQASATRLPLADDMAAAVITDPPYYDAVPYAYLSDFFHVWFRRTLGNVHPHLLRDSSVPKDEEIVVDRPHKLSQSTKDISFYERELARAFAESRRVVRPDGVGCIVFASKSTASWEAILKAIIDAGWIVTGSWPIDTERESRVAAIGQARLGSSVHIVVRPRETPSGALDEGEAGDWRTILEQLPKRIREWMLKLDAEGVVGADAIFACLGPALEIYSRYSRVERASGEAVLLPDYLEHVWSTVSTEALSLIFKDADAAGLEPDARLTAMWLWTLSSRKVEKNAEDESEADQPVDEDGGSTSAKITRGFLLEFDAARKIAQGLGVHLERCQSFVEIKGETTRLLSVAERVGYLFSKDVTVESRISESRTRGKKKQKVQPRLFQSIEEVQAEIEAAEAETAGKLTAAKPGATILDRVHQAMLLFSTGRGEALRRFLVDDGVGKDGRFWRLADSLNKLYPPSTEERRWVEGVLARKKGLGFLT